MNIFGSYKKKPVPSFSVLDDAKQEQFPVLVVPFYTTSLSVTLRRLNTLQIKACGDFSLIGRAVADKKLSLRELRDYAEFQNKICEAALVHPTYNELMDMVGNGGDTVNKAKKELHELEEKLFLIEDKTKMIELENEIYVKEMFCNYMLPDNFLAAVFMFAVGLDRSDIKKITDDMLLSAAYLAEKGHDNPADHFAGSLLTDFNKEDINLRAWYLLAQKRKK